MDNPEDSSSRIRHRPRTKYRVCPISVAPNRPLWIGHTRYFVRVPDLRRAESPVVDLPVDHKPTANSGPDIRVEHGASSPTRADPRFRQRRDIGIVFNNGWPFEALDKPTPQNKTVPI